MKIATSKKNRAGLRVQLMDGISVEFDKDCVGEVDSEVDIKGLMNRDSSISILEGEEPKSREQEMIKLLHCISQEDLDMNKGEDLKIGEIVEFEIPSNPIKEEILEGDAFSEGDLEQLTVSELKGVCKDSGFEEKLYKELRKADLVSFIIEKLG